MKRRILSFILVFSLVLSVFYVPQTVFAGSSLVTNDTAAKEFYANGHDIEIWAAPDEMKAQGYDLEINVLNTDSEEYDILETHYITGDYTVYGGCKTENCDHSSIQMYSGTVDTIVAGGKDGDVGPSEEGYMAGVAIYGGSIDSIRFVENGRVDYPYVFINDQGDGGISIANIIVGAEAGQTGSFGSSYIDAVSHPDMINLIPGYCGEIPLKDALVNEDEWMWLSIDGSKFTGLEAFETMAHCTINDTDMGDPDSDTTPDMDEEGTPEIELVSRTFWKGEAWPSLTYGLLGDDPDVFDRAELVSIKSDNENVIVAKKAGSGLWEADLTMKKVGKSKLTVEYKLDGNTYTTNAIYKVKKYPWPIKNLVVNGKNVKIGNNKFDYFADGYKGTTMKVKLQPKKGWKIDSASYSLWNDNTDKAGNIKKGAIKKGTKIKFPKKYDGLHINVILSNKSGDTLFYSIGLNR